MQERCFSSRFIRHYFEFFFGPSFLTFLYLFWICLYQAHGVTFLGVGFFFLRMTFFLFFVLRQAQCGGKDCNAKRRGYLIRLKLK